jgi:hypothetical protein
MSRPISADLGLTILTSEQLRHFYLRLLSLDRRWAAGRGRRVLTQKRRRINETGLPSDLVASSP